MGMGSKTDLYENYQRAQQNVGQNQGNPFVNLNISPIRTPQNQQQNSNRQTIQQPVTRPAQPRPAQNVNKEPARNTQPQGVVGQKVTKRTQKGDTYSYADVYDHSRDIKPRKPVSITFRIDADEYERIKAIAKRERISANQLINRVLSQYRG